MTLNLSKEAQKLYDDVEGRFELEAHHLVILLSACEALDRIRQAQRRVKRDGAYFTNRYGSIVAHPGLKVINENRTIFLKYIRELGLDLTESENRLKRQY